MRIDRRRSLIRLISCEHSHTLDADETSWPRALDPNLVKLVRLARAQTPVVDALAAAALPPSADASTGNRRHLHGLGSIERAAGAFEIVFCDGEQLAVDAARGAVRFRGR